MARKALVVDQSLRADDFHEREDRQQEWRNEEYEREIRHAACNSALGHVAGRELRAHHPGAR